MLRTILLALSLALSVVALAPAAHAGPPEEPCDPMCAVYDAVAGFVDGPPNEEPCRPACVPTSAGAAPVPA